MKLNYRDRISAPVVLVYWLILAGGLVVYSAIRSDALASTTPMCIGAIAGTALGQCLALRDLRTWVALLVIGTLVCFGAPLTPRELHATNMWMALAPAALCGFWSLSDRMSLVAFWFPAVIWMLSILDRTRGQNTPDGAGAALLGMLAVLFIVFLRSRESRRVGLWRTVAAEPLAREKPSSVLKDQPAKQVARAGWALFVSAITFAITAWVAPKLWRIESFDGNHQKVAGQRHDRYGSIGIPCCPADESSERSRVKEYFDIGRGHDAFDPPREGIECRACPQHVDPFASEEELALGEWFEIDWVALRRARALDAMYLDYDGRWSSDYYGRWSGGGYYSGGTGGYTGSTGGYAGDSTGGYSGDSTGGGSTGGGSTGGSTGGSVGSTAGSTGGSTGGSVGSTGGSTGGYTGDSRDTGPSPTPSAGYVAPQPPAPAPRPAPAPVPTVRPVTPPTPVQPPRVEPTPAPTPRVESPPAPQPPKVEPTPAPAPVPTPAPAAAPKPAAPAPAAAAATRPDPTTGGSSMLHWLVVLIAGALVFQLVALGLRPLRRLITLRHLRRPFWDETVDQRISNSWQLALVGLRDAGWRSTSDEAPREFADRVSVDGVDRCATILERARHGIGIDAEDLADMNASADVAYRSARGRIGPFGRLIAWLRWPLT